MVGGETHVETVGQMRLRGLGNTGVADQHIDRAGDARGEIQHRAKVRQIEPRQLRHTAQIPLDFGKRGLPLGHIAHAQHQIGTRFAQCAGGLDADARRSAGQHHAQP